MADVRRIGVDAIARHFEGLKDPRSSGKRRHLWVRVVVIALRAVLAGAAGPTAIAAWATLTAEFLREVLDLHHGIPCTEVVRRDLMLMKPASFQAWFAAWLQSLRATAAAAAGVERPIRSVDGKATRRSHDRRKGRGAWHSVSAWASAFGLSLGPVACAEKANAITAIPELLRPVDIKGAILTSDAMGAQTAIAAELRAGEGDEDLG